MENTNITPGSEHLTILIGRQTDGCTYQLDSWSRRWLTTRFPGAKLVPTVFVGYETAADFERVHGPLWPQIAQILTGLSEGAIRSAGGFTLYDPERETTVYEAQAA